jgi:hypothetical protein
VISARAFSELPVRLPARNLSARRQASAERSTADARQRQLRARLLARRNFADGAPSCPAQWERILRYLVRGHCFASVSHVHRQGCGLLSSSEACASWHARTMSCRFPVYVAMDGRARDRKRARFLPFKHELHAAAAAFHYSIDLLIGLPLLIVIALTGVLLLRASLDARLIANRNSALAVLVNLICVIVVVIRRGAPSKSAPDRGDLLADRDRAVGPPGARPV